MSRRGAETYRSRLGRHAIRGGSVQGVGRHEGGGDLDQRTVPGSSEKAAAPAGVAGDTGLIDQQQHGVAIAIEAQLAERWTCPEVSPLRHSLARERDE